MMPCPLRVLRKQKKAKTVLEDLNKNEKNSKYYKEYQNPDEEESLDVAKISAQIDKEKAESDVKAYREIADNIRNTKYGSKSIEEIANRKDTISKGVSRAVAVGGVALTALAYNKGAISKGAAATSLVLTGVAAGTTRLKTYGSVYDELKKRKNNTISSKNTTSWNDKKSTPMTEKPSARTNTVVDSIQNKKNRDKLLSYGYNRSTNNI